MTDCANPHCPARIDPHHMPGGYCGDCFRLLDPATRHRLAEERKRKLRNGASRHTVKP